LHTKEFIEGEFEFISKNLNLIWLRGNYYPVTDKRGKLVKIMQLSTDITEEIQQDEKTKNHLLDLEILRSQLMEKNRELEARNAVFVQILPTIEFSPDGEILAVNALFTEKFALPANDLVGKHHKILVDSKQVNSQAYNDFWIQLNKNETATWTHKNGHLAYHPIADATGRVIKILGVLR
jgi:methyl-accepting chemotaxis protein